MQSSINLYSIGNYTFGTKEASLDLDHLTSSKQVDQLYTHYSTKGMKTSVEAILMVHDHHHPNLLMFQDSSGQLSLPHGSLIMGEDETAGLKRILNSLLGSKSVSDWDIGEITSVLYRPNFETLWVFFLNNYSILIFHVISQNQKKLKRLLLFIYWKQWPLMFLKMLN